MKGFSVITAIAAVSLLDSSHAFCPRAPLSSGTASRRSPTRIHSAPDKDRIKKAGAGITTHAPGDLSFYDPNENGKLQGSGTLFERIENGASYSLSGSQQEGSSPPGTPTKSSPATVAKPKQNVFTTNLTKLLNGELDARFGGKSQY